MAEFQKIAPQYQLQRYSFGLAPLVDGQTDAALTYDGVSTVKPVMPWAGSIVAISANASAAAGAGAISFDALIGATQQSIDLSLATDATTAYDTYREGTYPFVAGSVLGASYTSGTLTTNGNVSVDIWVLFQNVRP